MTYFDENEYNPNNSTFESGTEFGQESEANETESENASVQEATWHMEDAPDRRLNTDNGQPVQRQHKKEKRYVTVGGLVACLLAVFILAGCIGVGLGVYFSGQRGNEQVQNSDSPFISNVANGSEQDKTVVVNVSPDSTVYSDMSELATNCVKYVVGIKTESGSGSGVIISSDGYIVTNNHVVDGAATFAVYLQDGSQLAAELIGSDARTDIAVLKVEAQNLPAATLGNSSDISVGETVIAVGNPLGELLSSVTDGIISGVNREVTIDGLKMNLIQTNAAINPGNSGGGLFNMKGELIGIVNAKSMGIEVEGLGFAIPADIAKTIVKEIIEQGYVSGRPYLGVSLQNITIGYGGQNSNPFGGFFGFNFGTQYQQRVQVMSVEAGSAAQKGGVHVNDIILKFAGTDVTTTDEIYSLLNEYNAGDEVTITVQRGNETVELKIVLGERTSSGK